MPVKPSSLGPDRRSTAGTTQQTQSTRFQPAATVSSPKRGAGKAFASPANSPPRALRGIAQARRPPNKALVAENPIALLLNSQEVALAATPSEHSEISTNAVDLVEEMTSDTSPEPVAVSIATERQETRAAAAARERERQVPLPISQNLHPHCHASSSASDTVTDAVVFLTRGSTAGMRFWMCHFLCFAVWFRFCRFYRILSPRCSAAINIIKVYRKKIWKESIGSRNAVGYTLTDPERSSARDRDRVRQTGREGESESER